MSRHCGCAAYLWLSTFNNLIDLYIDIRPFSGTHSGDAVNVWHLRYLTMVELRYLATVRLYVRDDVYICTLSDVLRSCGCVA